MNKQTHSIRYIAKEMTARVYDWNKAQGAICGVKCATVGACFDKEGNTLSVSLPPIIIDLYVMIFNDGFHPDTMMWLYRDKNGEIQMSEEKISEYLSNREIVDMAMEKIEEARRRWLEWNRS